MKKSVTILKEVQSYEVGKTYRLHSSFAEKLIRLGKAEEKEEKTVYETKEEKHNPDETKVNDFSGLAVTKIPYSALSNEDLLNIVNNDSRKGAIKAAQEELSKR